MLRFGLIPEPTRVWLASLLTAAMLVGGFIPLTGCGMLTGDTEEESDDSSSKKKKKKRRKKKKKKKKGSKKKKKKGTKPADPKPAADPCEQVLSIMRCMRDKLPPSSRAGMDKSIKSMKDSFAKAGERAEANCIAMLPSFQKSGAPQGCSTTGSPEAPKPVPGQPKPAPPPVPQPTSQQPSNSAFASHTQEVAVKGASKLNCTAKILRGWLRVGCRGSNGSGGTAKSVKVTKGRAKVSSGAGAMSMVLPWQPGTDVEANFIWTNNTKKLRVHWPSGGAEPTTKGEFLP